MTEDFDLKITKRLFAFVFRLYNFVEVAMEDDRALDNPFTRVGELRSEVRGMGYPALTTLKRKSSEDDDAGTRRSKRPRTGKGAMESDILSDAAIMEALECAGYTIPPEVENFKSLLPVSTSFP